ncbi:hypothetical protein BpHYR1_028956 [Brachionus plicatilis]|uniref:Uncharacterized protein n=1 Tax=Brachionus plicatilis TaxID=10195 RepID=A0A3M7SG00_BRAPC|nr:hypothetical protein BpHYR1_028956 [Brachionus plicatilis]
MIELNLLDQKIDQITFCLIYLRDQTIIKSKKSAKIVVFIKIPNIPLKKYRNCQGSTLRAIQNNLNRYDDWLCVWREGMRDDEVKMKYLNNKLTLILSELNLLFLNFKNQLYGALFLNFWSTFLTLSSSCISLIDSGMLQLERNSEFEQKEKNKLSLWSDF